MFEAFERDDIDTEDARIASFIGGSWPPLLLLPAYPRSQATSAFLKFEHAMLKQ
jgi:hypothetical protein